MLSPCQSDPDSGIATDFSGESSGKRSLGVIRAGVRVFWGFGGFSALGSRVTGVFFFTWSSW